MYWHCVEHCWTICAKYCAVGVRTRLYEINDNHTTKNNKLKKKTFHTYLQIPTINDRYVCWKGCRMTIRLLDERLHQIRQDRLSPEIRVLFSNTRFVIFLLKRKKVPNGIMYFKCNTQIYRYHDSNTAIFSFFKT